MAHTILGIDLGSYAIKVAQLEAGFRQTRLLALHARPLPPPENLPDAAPEPLLDRQLRGLRDLIAELGLQPEMTAVALGEAAVLRVVTVPISDPKKIEQILPFELEGQLLGEIGDHVVDSLVAQGGLTVEDGEAGQGTRLLAAVAPQRAVAELLGRLTRAGLEPRLVGTSALACAALLAGEVGEAAADLPAVIIDLGHSATQVCVLHRGPAERPAAAFARTIARGGQQLTQALSKALNLDLATAEARKHEASLDPGASLDPRVPQALREGLRPLLRDLRQTLASFMALYGEAPATLLLTGGGSRLQGIDIYLQEELNLPVRPLEIPQALLRGAETTHPLALQDAGRSCDAALGLALAVAGPAPQVNFRKGEFAYRSDYSFLREKAPQLGLIALLLLLCFGLSAVASLRGLQKESEGLATTLRNETMSLFGEPRPDGAAVSAELSSVINSARGGGQGVPTISALDLLEDISRAAPPSADKKGPGLDITELNIRAKRTDLKGTAASAQYVGDLAAALGKIPCFKNIEQGKVVTVRNTGPDGKPVDVKLFSFNITTTCP